MALQNAQSSQSVIDGKEFFRIKQELQSSGDIFELDTSSNAIYVGPDSDIAEMCVTYFDKRQPTGLATARISPGAPLVFRVDASNAQTVPSTGQKARILISPADLIDNEYTTPAIVQPEEYIRIKPKIDVVSALVREATLPSERSDTTFRTSSIKIGPGTSGADAKVIVFPAYSRRQITCTVSSPSIGATFHAVFEAVTLSTTPTAQVVKPISILDFPGTSILESQTFVINSSLANTTNTVLPAGVALSEYGQFDLLLITLQKLGGPFPEPVIALTIRATDKRG